MKKFIKMNIKNILKNTNYWKIGAIALLIALFFGGGFFLGRKTIKVTEKPHTVYIELPAIHDTIEKIEPVREKLDSANFINNCIASGKFTELFPEKVIVKDSIIYLNDEDYRKITMDWATERVYEETAFNSDTLGKFDYTAKVQYNQLISFGYNYTPLQKQQEIVQNQIKHFSPFIGAGISTLPSLELDFGAFIDDSWGFSFNGRYNMRYEQMGISKFDVGIKVLKKF